MSFAYPLTLVTPAVEEPISLARTKAHLRVDIADDDTYIGELIEAARDMAERRLGQALVSRTYTAELPGWPVYLELPYPPLASVGPVVYDDADGVERTLSTSYYRAATSSTPGLLEWTSAFVAPALDASADYPVRVTFVAGYGAASDVPASARHAIRMLVGHWYENREQVVVGGGSAASVPLGVERLLDHVWHGSYG